VSVVLTILLQLLVTYFQPLQSIFGTCGLPLSELALSISLSLKVFVTVKIEKWFKRKNQYVRLIGWKQLEYFYVYLY